MQRTVTPACCNVDAVSTLLALVDEAVVMADLDGNIGGWSRGAEQLLGYSAAEIIGRDCASIYVEDERAAHHERCRAVALGAAAAGFDATLCTRSGALLPARVEVALMHDAAGAPASLLASIRSSGDPAARTNVTLSQVREFWALMDYAPVGFWHLDANRRFAYANRAALAMAGQEHTDVAGRHLLDVLGEARYQQLLPAIDRVMAGSEARAELHAAGRNGGGGHHLVHLLPRRGPAAMVVGCFAAVLDITQAKLSEENRLSKEQLLRATLIRETNHRVKNSLQGLIGMMRLQASRGLSAADIIDQSVAQLMAVAVAYGLASRHGEAQILLCDLVADIASNVEQVSQRRIQVQLSGAAVREPIALSERYGANVSLIINELVSNAIKHSANAGGRRGVRISVDRDNDSAVLRVINEAGQLPSGFSFEGDSGLGTGLSLIKVLVPPECSTLSIGAGPEGVCAQLTLRQPVLAT